MPYAKNQKADGRAAIIREIKTPLGFMALALLVAEVLLGGLATKAAGTDFTVLICGMVAALVILLVGFFILALTKTGSAVLGAKIEAKPFDAFVSTPIAGPRAAGIVARIRQLKPNQALVLAELVENIAVRGERIRQLIQLWDPEKKRLSDGKDARLLLMRWASVDSRDSTSLAEWENGLDVAENV